MAFLMRIRFLPLLFALMAGPALAQGIALAEQKIKVGMLYNFLKYTDWPAVDASAPMVVCLFGGDPFDGNLQPMEGRSVNLRVIQVRGMDDPAAAASQCHLIVVDAQSGNWPALHTALHGKPVMTVSDDAQFIEQGGMIQFGHQGNRITVSLNKDTVEASHLRIEPRLLNLVTVVHATAQEGR
jgi:hypothetical protein